MGLHCAQGARFPRRRAVLRQEMASVSHVNWCAEELAALAQFALGPVCVALALYDAWAVFESQPCHSQLLLTWPGRRSGGKARCPQTC